MTSADNVADKGIYCEAVIAFLIVRIPLNKQSHYIKTYPITFTWDWDEVEIQNQFSIPQDAKILSVIPAATGTYQIFGTLQDESIVSLGYEYPGADHPDWNKELDSQNQALPPRGIRKSP